MKKMLCGVFTACLMIGTASAATEIQENDAVFLDQLGLFRGTEQGYELDRTMTRAEGAVMLTRLLGGEQEALKGSHQTPFTDVPSWAKPYVGWLYENKLTNGTGKTTYSPDAPMQFKQYAWFTGRAAGYTDAEVAAGKTRLSTESYQREKNKKITRGQAVALSMDTLYDPMANGTQTLADKLVSRNVFTREKWEIIQADYETATDKTLTCEKDILKNITELDRPYIIGSYAGTILLEDYIPTARTYTLYTWHRDSGLRHLEFTRTYADSQTSMVYDVSGAYCAGGYGLLYFKPDGTVTRMLENGATQVYRLDGKIYATDYVEAVPSREDETKPSGYKFYGGQTIYHINGNILEPVVSLPKGNRMRIQKHISYDGKSLKFETFAMLEGDAKAVEEPWIIQWDGKRFKILDLPTYTWKKNEFIQSYQKELDIVSKIK